MKVTWSIPVRGDRLKSGRGDLIRAYALIEALRAEGHDVVVVHDAGLLARLQVRVYRWFVRPLLPRRIAAVLRDAVRVRYGRLHAARLARAATRQRADLIIETQAHFADSGARAARALDMPLIVDDCSPWTEERVLGAGLPGLARRTFLRQADIAALLVVSSPRLRALLARDGVPSSRVRVVRNGVDATAYTHIDRPAARRRLGVEDRVVIGFAGSFKPWQGVDLLIEAVARVSDRLPLHLLLIGDGPGRHRAKKFARRVGLRDRATIPGAVAPAKVPELLTACDIGVVPASNEYGHPMQLLEYAAAGLAIVGPDVPAVREVVEHGETGLLFQDGNIGELGRRLVKAAEDAALRARLGAAARERATSGKSWADRLRLLIVGVEASMPARARLRTVS